MQDIEILRKKLLFRSNHRGTKELDLLIGKFATFYINDLSEEEIFDLEEILNENDPDLYNWVTKHIDPPKKYQHSLMSKFQNFKVYETNFS